MDFSLQLFSPIGDFICNQLGKISSVRKQNLACFYPGVFSSDDMLSQCLSHPKHIFDSVEKLFFSELPPHFSNNYFYRSAILIVSLHSKLKRRRDQFDR
jgi:hypothetical protein